MVTSHGKERMMREQVQRRRLLWAGSLLGAMLALGGCAATRITAQWMPPGRAAARLTGPVLVVGLTGEETTRRLFEDTMAATLAGRGVVVARSYQALDGALAAEGGDEVVLALARRLGATAVLSSALVAREQVQRIVTEPLPDWRWGYPGWFGHFRPLVARAELRTDERYVAATSLTDVDSGEIVWMVRTTTESPGPAETEISAFAQLIAQALARAGFL